MKSEGVDLSPKISVIVTTYNDGEYLEGALKSIENQTLKPAEVIVVDDGSDDRIAYEYVQNKSFPFPLRFYRKDNGGASQARNFGIDKASYDLLAFMDVDDSWLPDNLHHKFYKLAIKPMSYFGCYGGFLSTQRGYFSIFEENDGTLCADDIGKVTRYPGGAPSYLFRRHPLLEIGGFDTSLKQNEDFDLILRLQRAGYMAIGDNYPGFVRNMRSGSLTRHTDFHKAYNNVNLFFDKAERENYFSRHELNRRKTLQALTYWKSLFLNLKDFRLQKQLLESALSNDVNHRLKFIPLRLYLVVLKALV